MTCTTRYAHLSARPKLTVGDTLSQGQVIGKMGNSGQSFGAHLHLDCVKGRRVDGYTLADIERGDPEPWPRQLNWFIDEDLFQAPFKVTTPYADYDYQAKYKKLHCAYDVIPLSGDWSIYWSRTSPGTVVRIAYMPESYGWVVYITHEVEGA